MIDENTPAVADPRTAAIAALGMHHAAPFTENAEVYATIYVGDQLARIAQVLEDSHGDDGAAAAIAAALKPIGVHVNNGYPFAFRVQE